MPVDFPNAFSYFLDSIRQDIGFKLAYESKDVIIFGK
jgi:hypothetical protein